MLAPFPRYMAISVEERNFCIPLCLKPRWASYRRNFKHRLGSKD